LLDRVLPLSGRNKFPGLPAQNFSACETKLGKPSIADRYDPSPLVDRMKHRGRDSRSATEFGAEICIVIGVTLGTVSHDITLKMDYVLLERLLTNLPPPVMPDLLHQRTKSLAYQMLNCMPAGAGAAQFESAYHFMCIEPDCLLGRG
jgi:hypothetical protein